MDYEVTAPDGRRFVVTAPEGATQEQVLSYAQQNYSRPQQPPSRAPSDAIPGPRQYAAGEVPGEAVSNLPSSAGRFYGSVVEAVTSPVETAKSLAQLGLGAMRRANPLLARASDALYKPEFANQSDAAFKAATDMYAERYGSWEAAKRTIAEDPVGFLADVSTIFGGGAAAARGAGMTRTARVLQGAETATNPLTPVIAPIQMFGRGAGAGASRVYQSTDPESAFYREISEGREAQILDQMRGQGLGSVAPGTPGVDLTPAQRAAQAGAARFAATADVATTEKFPSEIAAREAAQDTARMSYMRQLSGAPSDPLFGRAGAVETATESRARKTGPMFERARATTVPADDTIRELLATPSGQRALSHADQIARDLRQPFTLRPPEPTPPSGLLTAEGRPMPRAPEPPQQYSVQDLEYVKRGLDKAIKDAENPMTGIGVADLRALEKLRSDFLDWLNKASVESAEARRAFADASRGIDRLKVAQEYESRLRSALTGGPDRAANFARAVENAPDVMRQATGDGRYAYLAELFGPDTKIINTILTDLRRQEQTNKLISQGRASVPDIERLFTAVSPATVPPFMDRVFTIARNVLNKLEGKIDQKTAIKIAQDLLDPAKTAAALDRAQTFAARQQQVGAAFRRPFEATAQGLRSPAARVIPQATNAMAPPPPQEQDPVANMFAPYFAR
jgi:hypothetical protein